MMMDKEIIDKLLDLRRQLYVTTVRHQDLGKEIGRLNKRRSELTNDIFTRAFKF